MKPLSAASGRVLDFLTRDLADPSGPGTCSRKLDNGRGYMPACVQRIGPNRYSIAHYFEQNGDLVPDPDLELVCWGGDWYPAAITMGPLGSYRRALTCDDAGRPDRYYPREYRDLRSFATVMIRNVREQQGIKLPRRSRANGGAGA